MKNKKKLVLALLFPIVFLLLNLSCQDWIIFGTNNSNTEATTGDYTKSIIHDGLKRTYRIHIPSSFDKTKPIPLVIVLHGGGGSAEAMLALTLGGFNTLSEREGFIVVYPNGIEKHWNDGRGSSGLSRYRAFRENIDDVGFISALIDLLIKEMNIDKKRIYITGISNGGIMSFRLACELSEKITAIASVTASMPEKLASHCSPLRPISVLIINGMDDPLVPWEGGEIRFGRLRLGKVLSVSETVKYWVKHNKCSTSPQIFRQPDKDPFDGIRVRKEVYGQGREGTEVVLYTIEGGGHTWPGGYQYLREGFIGKTSRDIDATEVIWNFFKRHVGK
jgi:polyhydroxybutyrate depolymerase